jgi:peroxiredoxin
LTQPLRALRAIEAAGVGGVADATWLVVIGFACFRVPDLVRALTKLSHLPLQTVAVEILASARQELLEAVVVVLGAALAVTVAAGRGRRAPSNDLELGAVAFVPFFAVHAAYRTLTLFTPLPRSFDRGAIVVAAIAALPWVVLAVMVARSRSAPEEGGSIAMAPLQPTPVSSIPASARVAAAALAAVLGAALFVNAGWAVQNGHAIRPLPRGKEAPPFSLPRIDGGPGEVSLGQFRGKVVLLDFWATWCRPCIAMMPTLHSLHEEWRSRGVEFVGISSDSPPESVRALLRDHPAPYPMVIDLKGEVSGEYKVVALPHMVLVGRDGAVRKAFWGVTSRAELAGALAAAVE